MSQFRTIIAYKNPSSEKNVNEQWVKCNFCNLEGTYAYINPDRAVFWIDENSKKHYLDHHTYIFTNAIFKLEHESLSGYVALKEVQRDPITDSIVHIDMYIISAEHSKKGEVKLMMPVNFVGMEQSTYIKQGAVLEKSHFIRVKANVKSIVPYINVDVSKMKPNTSLRQREVPLPDGLRLARVDNINVCTLHKAKGGSES